MFDSHFIMPVLCGLGVSKVCSCNFICWVNKFIAHHFIDGKLSPEEGKTLALVPPQPVPNWGGNSDISETLSVPHFTFHSWLRAPLKTHLCGPCPDSFESYIVEEPELNVYIRFFPSRWYPWSSSHLRFHGDWEMPALYRSPAFVAQPLLFTKDRIHFPKD